MLEIILIIVTLFVLAIASYTDLKSQEVPDWLSFALIGAAMGIRSIFSFSLGWEVLVAGLLGLLVCFVVACGFYYTDQWGGGDSKLLLGLGAVIGFNYPFNLASLELAWFLLLLLFIGALYGLFWLGGVAVKNWRIFSSQFKQSVRIQRKIQLGLGSFSLLFLAAGFLDAVWFILFFLPLGVFYTILFISATEKSCLYKQISPHKLVEGDWLAEDVLVNGRSVLEKKTLSKKDLFLLKKMEGRKQLNSVLIKQGIPFIPSFLITYVIFTFFREQLIVFLTKLV